MGAFLLGVLLLLQAAAVLPTLHALWHDEHGCDPADCAVATVASGAVDRAPELEPLAVAQVSTVLVSAMSEVTWRVRADCPPLPGRAPPV